jgi:hypothetical protein
VTVKLREWADKQGVSYRTALRWFHAATLPVEAEQVATGTIIVKLDPSPSTSSSRFPTRHYKGWNQFHGQAPNNGII